MMISNPKILNIAHRGARSLAPENTLLAAQKGWEIGADLWELDVAVTADGEMVVIHDDTLARTSNAAEVFPGRALWEVHNFTLLEIKSLDFGSWYLKTDPFSQIATGNVPLPDQQSFKDASIPTLREALEFTKSHQWRVNVEIKNLTAKPGDAFVVENVITLIKDLQMEDDVLISSFNHPYLVRVKKANPVITTAALVGQTVADPVALLAQLGADAFNPSIGASHVEQFAALRKAGKDIFVWTVNDEGMMERLIEMGATGLITDFPQRLKSILSSP